MNKCIVLSPAGPVIDIVKLNDGSIAFTIRFFGGAQLELTIPKDKAEEIAERLKPSQPLFIGCSFDGGVKP